MQQTKLRRIDVESEFGRCIETIGGQKIFDIVGPSPNFNNADYLFHEYEVIAELKCLEENKGKDEKLKERVHELYNKYLREGKADLIIYGEVEINANDVSKDFGLELMEMFRAPIQRVIKKANKQIRQTKEHLHLTDHTGVLLLVNDGHEMLSPDQVKWILENTLSRNSYSSINTVIFFTVNLMARHPDFDEDLLLWAVMDRPGHKPCSDKFHEQLSSAWINHYRQIAGDIIIRKFVFEEGEPLRDMENVRT